MSATAYPLTWPDTLPRSKGRASSQFKTSLAGALNNVQDSLRRFAADSGKKLDNLVISSNVTLGIHSPEDPGVAVWFVWDGMQVSIAVDRYPKVQDNLQAIHHIIEARRTELRHGGLHIVRATFRGFQALPSPGSSGKRTWREILNLVGEQNPTREQIDHHYRTRAKKAHPDAGGSEAAMAELNRAREEAIAEMNRENR